MSSHHLAALMGVACVAVAVTGAAAQTQGAPISRQEAFARALAGDPGILAADQSRLAAEASLRQARRLANPTLDILKENVSGSGPYKGGERAETTYSLRQPFEFGGDRGARRGVAARGLDVAAIEASISRLDLLESVEHAFIDAQAAEAALEVAEERLSIDRDLNAAIDRRVKAARDPLMAGSRSIARLAEAEIEAENARRAVVFARTQLASYWGGNAAFQIETDSFEALPVVAPPALPVGQISPDLKLAEAQTARAEAQVKFERAKALPDFDVQAGWRQFSESDETAFVFGFSIPLQIWDRNGAGIARARADSMRASYERAARERQLQRQEMQMRAQLDAARIEVATLDETVIPKSALALSQARQGYAAGGFSYIDVLDAQRALSDFRLRRIQALKSYHRAAATLARLSGAHVEEISQ